MTTTVTVPRTYRIESAESAVKATIRQVVQPAVREAMWSAWQAAIEVATSDSPDVMPWETAKQASTITGDAAHRAMVRVLEAIGDIDLRHRIRDLLALEAEFIEPEDDGGIRQQCQHCGRPYRPTSSRSRYCRPACRSAAYKTRKAAREADVPSTTDRPGEDMRERGGQARTEPTG
jgi:hypothetical protein